MKKLQHWFIGDYLAETDDVFIRARIRLMYSYSMAFILLGTFYYIDLILRGLYYHAVATTFAVLALFSIPFLLKYKRNINFVSRWYVIQQVIMGVMSVSIDHGNDPMPGIPWVILFFICAVFLFGRKNGLLLFLMNVVITSLPAVLKDLYEMPKSQALPPSPDLIALPIILIGVVVWNFVRSRTEAEMQINKQKEELEQRNREVTDSITYAQRIQKAILPSQRILDHFLPGNFLLYLPKDIVSGDFYWVEKKGDKTFFAVVDCTGHGVPGAMMSVIGQNALNRVLNEFNLTDPAKMLDKLNELVEESFSKSGADIRDGMDIALCAIDYPKMELEYAGANNEIYIISNGSLQVIKATKQPIGRFESKVPFQGHRFSLQKGDCIYLFTDGIADQFGGPQGKKFKYKRVKEMLLANANAVPREQKNNTLSIFSEWKGKLEQVDDVCLLGLRL